MTIYTITECMEREKELRDRILPSLPPDDPYWHWHDVEVLLQIIDDLREELFQERSYRVDDDC